MNLGTTPRVRRLIIGVMAIVLLVTGCGVKADAGPRTIADNRLPSDLTGGAVPTPIPGAPEFKIWMVGAQDLLTPVLRTIALPADPSDQAKAMLDALFAGTFPQESRLGIKSAINRGTEVQSALVTDGGIVYVDLASDSSVSSSRNEQEIAFAQMVWTLTELRTIDKVIFTRGNELIGVPIDGVVTRGGEAVDRTAFASLDPRNRIAFPDDSAEDLGDVIPVLPTPVDALPSDFSSADSDDEEEASNEVELVVWLVNSEGFLVRQARIIADRAPELLLDDLMLGPKLGEPEQGIRSALLPTGAVLNIDVNEADGTAFVDLAAGTLPPVGDGDERLRAVAQLVYTLTELAEISQVSISILGQREAMPTQNGTADPEVPLTREDFALLVGEEVVGVEGPTPEPTVEPTPDADGSAAATPEPELAEPEPEPSAEG